MRPWSGLVGAAIILAGCAHTERFDDGLDYERRQTELGAIAYWDIRGGIAVDDGDRSYQARFTWEQRGEELELVVWSRLPGTRRFRIEGTDSNLTVQSGGETEILTDPERQLSEMLGWWLPVTSAEHWLLGRPDPDYSAQSSRGDFDTLQMLGQRDWQISYDEYQIAEGRLIPRRIKLIHAPLELSLRIIEWQSAAPEP